MQPANPAEVARVAFTAGGTDLGTDATPVDGFKVFLAAKDYPAGPLALEASVTGTDGKVSTHAISVTNVPSPTATATVTAAGAVLGAAEVDGSLSTLAIAPGDATGATVTFATRTKDQVKAATGVDYDALGGVPRRAPLHAQRAPGIAGNARPRRRGRDRRGAAGRGHAQPRRRPRGRRIRRADLARPARHGAVPARRLGADPRAGAGERAPRRAPRPDETADLVAFLDGVDGSVAPVLP